MARITVEDCLEKITSRFELVALASERTKAISCGSPITVDEKNDKKSVIALREISKGNIDIDKLREELISGLQTKSKIDVIQEENLYAENQENETDNVGLSDESSSMFSTKEYSDLEPFGETINTNAENSEKN